MSVEEETPHLRQLIPNPAWIHAGRKDGNVLVKIPWYLYSYKDDEEKKLSFCHRYVGKHPDIIKLNTLRVRNRHDSLIKLAAAMNHDLFVVVVHVIEIKFTNHDDDDDDGNVNKEFQQLSVELMLYMKKESLLKSYTVPFRSYWSEKHVLFAAFLMDKVSVETIGDPLMKTTRNENGLMIASTEKCGYYIDPHSSLLDMFKSILRESIRLNIGCLGCHYNSYFENIEKSYVEKYRY